MSTRTARSSVHFASLIGSFAHPAAHRPVAAHGRVEHRQEADIGCVPAIRSGCAGNPRFDHRLRAPYSAAVPRPADHGLSVEAAGAEALPLSGASQGFDRQWASLVPPTEEGHEVAATVRRRRAPARRSALRRRQGSDARPGAHRRYRHVEPGSPSWPILPRALPAHCDHAAGRRSRAASGARSTATRSTWRRGPWLSAAASPSTLAGRTRPVSLSPSSSACAVAPSGPTGGLRKDPVARRRASLRVGRIVAPATAGMRRDAGNHTATRVGTDPATQRNDRRQERPAGFPVPHGGSLRRRQWGERGRSGAGGRTGACARGRAAPGDQRRHPAGSRRATAAAATRRPTTPSTQACRASAQ